MKVEDVAFKPQEKSKDQEQKEQLNKKLLMNMTVHKFRSILLAIDNELYTRNITLEELKQEIERKQSKLSSNQRSFVLGFKLDFIQELLSELNASRNLS